MEANLFKSQFLFVKIPKNIFFILYFFFSYKTCHILMQLMSSVLKSIWTKGLTTVAAETGVLPVQRLQLDYSTSMLAVHVSQASSWTCVENGVVFWTKHSLQSKMNSTNTSIFSWLKEKSSRYWMPLTTLTINAQGNHCVRHSKGSYQSREISHTDIHSHARTHVRYCMHCFLEILES